MIRHRCPALCVLALVAFLTSDAPATVRGDGSTVSCPDPGTTPASEECLRKELGIPPDANRVVIISQSSHLDWDWRHTFENYFAGPLVDPFLFLLPGPVDTILSDAVGLMTRFHGSGVPYYYSVAEMGYLARFVQAHPELLEPLHAVGNDLRIVGGGVTSPDSLLPPGESFIRDYLVGKSWVDATLGLPIRAAWLPDDFGLDSQLPIVLEAMGLGSVGFGRVPGVDSSARSLGFQPPVPGSIAETLLHDGLDFRWRAADGSEVLAHWMPGGYCQGDWALGPVPGRPSTAALEKLVAIDGAAAQTPYLFIPIGCDFARPRPDLLDVVAAWNADAYARTGVWAVAATFDHYAQLLQAHRKALPARRFDPTPYWTGFYATRPLLKGMHLRATQALLAAETFGAIADATGRRDPDAWRAQVSARTTEIHAGWTTLVPGNHHDFITGTALDPVYETEQLPRLATALTQGETARTQGVRRDRGRHPTAPVRRGHDRGCLQPARLCAPRARRGPRPRHDDRFPPKRRPRRPRKGVACSSRACRAWATRRKIVRERRSPPRERVSLYGHVRWDRGRPRERGASRDTPPGHRMGHRVPRRQALPAGAHPARSGGECFRAVHRRRGPLPLRQRDAGVQPRTSSWSGPRRRGHGGGARAVARALRGRDDGRREAVPEGVPARRGRAVPAHDLDGLGGPRDLGDGAVSGDRADRPTPPRDPVPLGPEAARARRAPHLRGDPRLSRAAVPREKPPRDLPRRRPGVGGARRGHGGRRPLAQRAAGAVRLLRGGGHRCAHGRRVLCGAHPDRHPEPAIGDAASRGAGLRDAGARHDRAPGEASLPRSFSLASVTPPQAIITAAKAGTEDPDTLVLRVYQPTNAPLRVRVRTRARLRFPPQRRARACTA